MNLEEELNQIEIDWGKVNLYILETLTPRETEIWKGLGEGEGVIEMAERLGIGTRTVETHLRSLYRKLSIKDPKNLNAALLRVKYYTRQLERELQKKNREITQLIRALDNPVVGRM